VAAITNAALFKISRQARVYTSRNLLLPPLSEEQVQGFGQQLLGGGFFRFAIWRTAACTAGAK
jgi:hypothetical protein